MAVGKKGKRRRAPSADDQELGPVRIHVPTGGTPVKLARKKRKRGRLPSTNEDNQAGMTANIDSRVMKEFATLAACSSLHPQFAQAYKFLCSPEADKLSGESGWCSLGPQLPMNSTPTLLGIDVEMLIRVEDGQRFPIQASIVRLQWARPLEVVFSGFIEPDLLAWDSQSHEELIDWKTEIHGISRQTLINARARGQLHRLSAVQTALVQSLTSSAFLVGHSLDGDLRSLKLRGKCLFRAIIDTVMLFPRGLDQKRSSLKDLVHKYLNGSKHAMLGFQDGNHDSKQDAEAAVRLVEHEAECLLADSERLPGGGDHPVLGELRLTIEAAKAGIIIGQKGATLQRIRAWSKAEVSLEPAQGRQRAIVISGTEGQVRSASSLLREVAGAYTRVTKDFSIAPPMPPALARFTAEVRESGNGQAAAGALAIETAAFLEDQRHATRADQDLGEPIAECPGLEGQMISKRKR